LLSMTLWLPLLDYARSYRPHVMQLKRWIPPEACIDAPNLSRPLAAALEYHGRWRVEASAGRGGCPYLLLTTKVDAPLPAPAGWQRVAIEQRPTDKDDLTVVFRRP
jgi:hypothetical protein